MNDYKIILGYTATILAVISYFPYFKNIFQGKTKPHAFSWLVWSVITGIAFAVQLFENGGPGIWVTALTCVACFVIFILALVKGEKHFALFDWVSLISAFVALVLWRLTSNPTLSVILISLTELLAFLPSFRKGFYKPNEETILTFGLDSIKFIISILALTNLTLETSLYSGTVAIMNALFVVMILTRRKQLSLQTQKI